MIIVIRLCHSTLSHEEAKGAFVRRVHSVVNNKYVGNERSVMHNPTSYERLLNYIVNSIKLLTTLPSPGLSNNTRSVIGFFLSD